MLAAGDDHAVSVREVSRRAGVSPGALYRHFTDREALMVAVAVRAHGRFARALIKASRSVAGEGPGDATDRIAAMGRAYVRFAVANPGAFRLMFSPSARGHSDPASYGALLAGVDALVRTGVLAKDDRVAPLIWATVHGIAALHLEGAVAPDAATAAADAERAVRALVAGFTSG